MNLQFWIRILIHQRPDAARLRPGKVMAYDASRGEVDGKFRVDRIAALPPRQAHEARLAVGMEEPATFEEPGRAGMLDGRARPEDTLLPVDPLVGDAVVVGGAALRRQSQFLEDFARLA